MIRLNTAVRNFARSFFPYSKPAIFSTKHLLVNCIDEDINYGKNLYKPDPRIFEYLKKNNFEVSDSNASSKITLTKHKDDFKIIIDFETDKLRMIDKTDRNEIEDEEEEDKNFEEEKERDAGKRRKKAGKNEDGITLDQEFVEKVLEVNFLAKKNMKRALIEREKSEVTVDDLRKCIYYFHVKVFNEKTEKGVIFLCFAHNLELEIKNIINIEQVRKNQQNPNPHKRYYQGPHILKLNKGLIEVFNNYLQDLLLQTGLLEILALMMIDKNKRLEMIWKKNIHDILIDSS